MKTPVSNQQAYLFRQLPNPLALVNSKYEVVMASDKWLEFFDLSRTETIGKKMSASFSNEQFDLKELISTCISCPGNYSYDSTEIKKGESITKFSLSPWYDEAENLAGALIEAKDVTQQHRVEQKLERFDAFLHGFSTISKVGMWEYDIPTKKLFWSEMTKRIHEVSGEYEPNLDSSIEFYKPGYNQNTFSMCIHNAIEKNISFKERLQIMTNIGRERWVIVAGQTYFKKGKAVRLVGTLQDVTAQVEAEARINEDQQLLLKVIDTLPLNLYIKDKNFRKTLVNKAECEYLGVSDPKDLLGKSDFDLYDEKLAKRAFEEDKTVIKTQKPILRSEFESIKNDGTRSTLLTSKFPLIDSNGKANGLIGISIDITDLKNKENQLLDLINVTAVQNKKLTNFAHIVSHNLRSHTANFSMLLKFLKEEKEEAEKSKLLEMLTGASNSLMDTLDDLNQVVEINANVSIDREEVNLKKIISRVESNLSAFLKKNKASLYYESIGDSTFLNVIPAYLDSILMNLITNAVKYKHPNKDPQVIISYEKLNDVFILSVKDNGLGIDLKKHGEKLFGMYKTFHQHKDAKGIGLYISKNQMEAMGGKIIVDSEVETGTTFKLCFYESNK